MFFRKRDRPAAPTVHATDQDFAVAVSEVPLTVVDFWAPWCSPCRMMGPILDELALEYEDRARILKVNVDQAPETAETFGIRSIPTLMFFRAGEPLFEMVGLVPKPVLEREIETLLEEAGSGSESQP